MPARFNDGQLAVIVRHGIMALALLLAGCSDESTEDTAKPELPAPLQPGLWETSIEVIKGLGDKVETSEGSYAVTGLIYAPPRLSECMTPDQAANPFRRFWFMTGYVDGKSCNYDQFSMRNGKIQGKIDCRRSGQGELSVDGWYTPTSYGVVTKTELIGTESGTDFSMRIPLNWKTTAMRIGECPTSSKLPPPTLPAQPKSQSPPPPPPPPPPR